MATLIERLRSWWDDRKRSISLGSSSLQDPSGWLAVEESDTGIAVTEDAALETAAVFSAVTLISETLATLPVKFFRQLPDDSRVASAHPIGRLFRFTHDGVSPSYHLVETATAAALVWGNGYARIHRRGGQAVRLELVEPWRMQPVRTDDGASGYVYTDRRGRREALLTGEVLHVRGPSPDGFRGYPRVQKARRAVALLIAAERYSGSYFSDGAAPSMGLEHPGLLSPEAHQNIRDQVGTGFRHAHRLFVAEEGMKIVQTGANPNDSQLIETRNAQVLEICRLFRVPPRLLMAELASFTYSNLLQDNASFVQFCLLPWAKRWTSEIELKLLASNDVYCEFVFDGLLAGTTTERYQAYGQALGKWLTRDEIRRRENLPPWPAPANGEVSASGVGGEEQIEEKTAGGNDDAGDD